MLQDQEATKGQLNAVRGLRAQLLDTCQVRGEELEEAGIRTTFDEDKQEEVLYSSDEDEQQLSLSYEEMEAMRDRKELLKDALDVTKEVVEAILESGPTLGAGAAVKVAGKIPKVIKAAKATKVVGKAGITSAIKEVSLPSSGKIRFIPRPADVQSGNILKKNGGYVDKFGNIWKRGPSRTKGEIFEWDIQLSQVGKQQLGHLSKSGEHVNVSLRGAVTH